MATAAEVQKRKEEFLNSTEAPAFSCIENDPDVRKEFVDALENRALMTTTKKEAPRPVGDDPGCPPGQEISFCDPNSGPKSQEKIRLGKGRINFQVYSWGGPVKADGTKTGIKPIDLAPQHTGRLTLETFLKHYFGYVAARLK